MAMAAIVYLLFMSLSLHACTARRLGFSYQEDTLRASLKKVEPMLPALRLMSLKGNLRAEAEEDNNNVENKGQEELLQIHTPELIQGPKKRQARLMTESAPPDNTEEAMVSKEKDIGEDMVVMDYAQPHRKPPIHN